MKIINQIHRAYFLLLLFFTFLIYLPFYLFLLSNEKYYLWLNRWRKFHCYQLLYACGFFPKFYIQGLNKHTMPCIYCANHTSNLDIMLMCVIAKGNFAFIGKAELLDHIVLKYFFRTIDIPVDRNNRKSAFLAFKKADILLKKGMSLIIFPEGKISDTYPPVLEEFKNGPFKLAIENKVPIVPISFQNIWGKMWDDGKRFGTKPGICSIFVHSVVETKDMNESEAGHLKECIYQQIKSKL